ERERGQGGGAAARGAGGHDDGGDGDAVYPVGAHCGDRDPWHALDPKRRSQHGDERRGTAAGGLTIGARGAALGPAADSVVAVATYFGFSTRKGMLATAAPAPLRT